MQSNERIIGFYGRSWWGRHFDGLVEFGIITAPKDVKLPEKIYSMKELQNTDGGREVITKSIDKRLYTDLNQSHELQKNRSNDESDDGSDEEREDEDDDMN